MKNQIKVLVSILISMLLLTSCFNEPSKIDNEKEGDNMNTGNVENNTGITQEEQNVSNSGSINENSILIEYKIYDIQGELIEDSKGEFIEIELGKNYFPLDIEDSIKNMSSGETKQFEIPSKEVFGEDVMEETLSINSFDEKIEEVITKDFLEPFIFDEIEKSTIGENKEVGDSFEIEFLGIEGTIEEVKENSYLVKIINDLTLFQDMELEVGLKDFYEGIGNVEITKIEGDQITISYPNVGNPFSGLQLEEGFKTNIDGYDDKFVEVLKIEGDQVTIKYDNLDPNAGLDLILEITKK